MLFYYSIAGRKRKGEISPMAGRSAAGTGTIRKKTVTRRGKTYEYWEARYTAGTDPGTGKQIQRSISGKTQKEVAQKLRDATAAIDSGTYTAPNKQTVGQWLDTWAATYLGGIKPRTREIYACDIRMHIKPALGAIRLEALDAPTIQAFYNHLLTSGRRIPVHDKDGKVLKKNGKPVTEAAPMSAKTIKNIHGVLHKALKQAVELGYLRYNPADACKLPRIEKPELTPLDDTQIAAFLQEIHGGRFETLLTVALFTGMREGEVMGLTWDSIDFRNGTITINKQLILHRKASDGKLTLGPTKNGKARTIAPAASVMALLRRRQAEQATHRLRAGALWQDHGLVFTDELGEPLAMSTVFRDFKKAAAAIGRPDARFHDLRHSYAVAAIRSGDDIKTVQGNLGHATAAFTLDVYGHVTDQMKRASADRMDAYIKSVSGK